MASFKALSQHLCRVTEENWKPSVKVASDPAEIWAGHLQIQVRSSITKANLLSVWLCDEVQNSYIRYNVHTFFFTDYWHSKFRWYSWSTQWWKWQHWQQKTVRFYKWCFISGVEEVEEDFTKVSSFPHSEGQRTREALSYAFTHTWTSGAGLIQMFYLCNSL